VKLRHAQKDPPRPSIAEVGHPHTPDLEMEEGQETMVALRDEGAGGNLRRLDGLKRGPPPTPRPCVTRSTSVSMAGQDPAKGKVISLPPYTIPCVFCSCKQIELMYLGVWLSWACST
jgi:hypothetical protein